MKVKDIMTGLLNAELSNTALVELEESVLNTKMLIWVNQALRDINLRIPIIQRDHTYQLVTDSIDGGMSYAVPADYQGLLYAWDENGRPIAINNSTDPLSIYTPEPFKILIPYGALGAIINIIYQASVPTLTSIEDNLPVADHFEAVLTYYIAGKALSGLETQGKPVNVSYEQRYENALALLKTSGMYNPDPIQEVSHFDRGGWR